MLSEKSLLMKRGKGGGGVGGPGISNSVCLSFIVIKIMIKISSEQC